SLDKSCKKESNRKPTSLFVRRFFAARCSEPSLCAGTSAQLPSRMCSVSRTHCFIRLSCSIFSRQISRFPTICLRRASFLFATLPTGPPFFPAHPGWSLIHQGLLMLLHQHNRTVTLLFY